MVTCDRAIFTSTALSMNTSNVLQWLVCLCRLAIVAGTSRAAKGFNIRHAHTGHARAACGHRQGDMAKDQSRGESTLTVTRGMVQVGTEDVKQRKSKSSSSIHHPRENCNCATLHIFRVIFHNLPLDPYELV